MADGPNFSSGYVPDRKIYSDASGVNNAFLSGLGNANLSATKDISEGINSGLDLAAKGLKLIEAFGPQAQERKQLELETERARLEAAKNISTVEALKAKNAVLNDSLQQAATRSELTAKNLVTEEAIKNHAAVTEAASGLAQIQDRQSFDDFLKDSKYNSIRTDPAFGSAVRNKAANLLNTTNDPNEQVALIRSAEAAVPGSGKQLQGLANTAAQALLQSPVEQAQLAKAQQPAKLDKYSTDILKRQERIFTGVNSALSEANIQPSDKVSYNPASGQITIQPLSGNTGDIRKVQVNRYGKQDKEADFGIDQTIQEKFRNKDYSPLGQQQSQQTSKGTGSLAAQPSLAPQAKTVSELVQSPQGQTLYKMSETILGDANNRSFDNQLSAINLYAKNSIGGYKPEVVRKMTRDMFKDIPNMPEQVIETTADRAVAYADQIVKQNEFRFATIDRSPDRAAELVTPGDIIRQQKAQTDLNLTPEQKARAELSFPSTEKKSSESVSPIKNISFVDRPEEVPSEVLDALRQVESAGGKFNTGPMTKYGQAKGPYQILDSTGMKYHEKLKAKDPDYDYSAYNPYNEEQSRQIAQAILADELKRFKGDLSKALTSYHSGPEAARSGNLGPEGKAYAPKVMSILNGISI